MHSITAGILHFILFQLLAFLTLSDWHVFWPLTVLLWLVSVAIALWLLGHAFRRFQRLHPLRIIFACFPWLAICTEILAIALLPAV